MECPSCKADIPEGNRFCEACGAPVPILCPSCGVPARSGARFCGRCGAALIFAASPAIQRRCGPRWLRTLRAPPVEAERRQLTVMFCDLVGSTPLSTRFDPEDLREIVGAYHRCVADTVARFGGFVAKYMGDGVLIYFGYPEAHEDDAERAVRAGLSVIEAVGKLAAPERLNVRLGIASGLVVVGDLIGTGAAQEHGVVGETPNLAARIQALAQRGTIVIADSTRRQIGALFESRISGCSRSPGLPNRSAPGAPSEKRPPQPLRSAAVGGRHRSSAATRSSNCYCGVGGRRKPARAGWRWSRASLVSENRAWLPRCRNASEEPHTRLRYFCSPHYQDRALYPFIVQLERAAGFARDDTVEQKLGKLRKLLTPAARGDDEIELLAELLSLPSAAAEASLSPQRKREKRLEALLHQLEARARSRPVLMVFEDTHWVDPTSRELLDLTVARVAHIPVLLVITFRPEFQHGWGGEPHVTALSLNRLAGRDGVELVERLVGNAGLSHETVDEIVERADGVPLFVEEATKAVLETNDRVLAASALPESRSRRHFMPH